MSLKRLTWIDLEEHRSTSRQRMLHEKLSTRLGDARLISNAAQLSGDA